MRFMNAMDSVAKVTGKDVATAFDLSRFRIACDVGGISVVRMFYSCNIVIKIKIKVQVHFY